MAASLLVPRRMDEYVPGRPTTVTYDSPSTVVVPEAKLVNNYSSDEHRVFSDCPVCHELVQEGLDTGGSVTSNNYRQHFVDEHTNIKKGPGMAKGSTTKADEARAQREAAANKREGTNGAANGEAKPAAKAKAAKVELAPIVQKDLIQAIGQYVNSQGSSEPDAPMNGAPFVQKGRVYMQLGGRGGVGKGVDVAEENQTGLHAFLRSQGSTMAASKRQLQGALSDLGFGRSPFAYVHPDRGSTAASYYSADIKVLKGVTITLPERVGKREVAKAEKEAAAAAAPAEAPAEAPTEEQATA